MAVSQITPTLFLSGADASSNGALLSKKGITLIVNATLTHSCPAHVGVECVRVPVPDLPTARLGDHFDRIADRIHGNKAGSTLVHCAAGMSRSPALVMAYLMRYRAVTLCQAHRWVQDRRPFIRLNAGFWEQLLLYERRLYGKNSVRVAPVQEAPPAPPPRTTRTLPPPSPRTTRTLPPPSPRTTRTLPPPSPRTTRTLPPPSPRTTRTLPPPSPRTTRTLPPPSPRTTRTLPPQPSPRTTRASPAPSLRMTRTLPPSTLMSWSPAITWTSVMSQSQVMTSSNKRNRGTTSGSVKSPSGLRRYQQV
ncbi:uncharacterized protein V6R79_007346 [Siganus canaliculatus]